MQFDSRVPSLLRPLAGSFLDAHPEGHEITYAHAMWRQYFQDDGDLLEINRRFGNRISRGDVINLGREAQRESRYVRRFAMAVMIWGYGDTGYGPWRTREMLSHPEAVDRLLRGAEIVRSGDLVNACLYFRGPGKLSRFGWAFFTKYFYFVGVASGLGQMPLILDGSSRELGVAGGMELIAEAGSAEAREAMDLWWSSSDKKCAEGYQLYVRLVNQWARELNCRPDAIEMELWRGLRP